MKNKDRQLCEAVLSPGKEIGRLSLVKVERDGALLLALPLNRRLALATLALYQPQRLKARLLRRVIRVWVLLGLHRFLPKFELVLGDEGVFSGLDQMALSNGFGFLLGNVSSPMRNLIGLYETGGILRVVKAGLGKAAPVVRDEYASMRDFSRLVVGVPECLGLFDIENGAAYIAELVSGRSPRGADDDMLVFELLNNWLQIGNSMSVSNLDCWEKLAEKLDDDTMQRFAALARAEVTSPVMHGDFAPWNIKISDNGEVKVLDWEFGQRAGMPSWDALHYMVQRMCLVEKCPSSEVINTCMIFLSGSFMQSYLKKAGLQGNEKELLESYLYYSAYVQAYPREELIILCRENLQQNE